MTKLEKLYSIIERSNYVRFACEELQGGWRKADQGGAATSGRTPRYMIKACWHRWVLQAFSQILISLDFLMGLTSCDDVTREHRISFEYGLLHHR